MLTRRLRRRPRRPGAAGAGRRRWPSARLSAAEGRALISLLAPERAADADALVDDADGHPLFLQELVRHSAGAVARLDEALWGRVSRMERTAQRVLEMVAVAGGPAPQGVIGTALALDRRALAKALDRLRATWLVRTGGTRSHDPVEPYHDRVREAVVARIPPARRRRHHQLAGGRAPGVARGRAGAAPGGAPPRGGRRAGPRRRAGRGVGAAGQRRPGVRAGRRPVGGVLADGRLRRRSPAARS
jgi:hypothetical protein